MPNQYEQKPNSGALFQNDKKKPGDEKFPDFKGSLNVDGTDYWISGWKKVSKKSGKKYMSLSVKSKGAPKASAGDDW